MAGKKKRVFIGIPISPQLQKKITSWTKKNLGEYKLRKIAGKNLHITLIPPWYVSNVDSVVEKLQVIKGKVQPFELRFNEVSLGPDPRRPRLVWVSGNATKEIIGLKKQLESALDSKAEKRSFRLHLTLARFKKDDYKSFADRRLKSDVDWNIKVNKICLYKSKLVRTGADYNIIKSFKLQ